MKKLIIILFRKIFSPTIIIKIFKKLIKIYDINLKPIYFDQIGIMKYQNELISGEFNVVKNVLPEIIDVQNAIMFDVGANVGDYSTIILNNLKIKKLYSFEPNPVTFEKLKENTQQFENIQIINEGLSDKEGSIKIYTYKDQQMTGHASFYETVLTDLHKNNNIQSALVNVNTLDSFCSKQDIESIDFLKIDTEGHELAVLEGAKELISKDKIKIIQFEFNEMNVVSRVFLKDFYSVLCNYNIFRVDTNKLIFLPEYQTCNEIFQFQNFLAIHKNISLPKSMC